jgi:purine-binding chemotaxis protein CheW
MEVTAEKMDFQEETEDTMRGRFLTFAVGEEIFGIEIRYVTEIIGMQPINCLPEVPEYVKGIINLRGKIIPVIDMRLKLKKEELGYTDRTCIVVVETGESTAGLIVDSVAEVMVVQDQDIVPPPDVQSETGNRYISGIGKAGDKVILFLDCEKLFSCEEEPAGIGVPEKP